MGKTLLITRPLEDAAHMAKHFTARGLNVLIEPLLALEHMADAGPRLQAALMPLPRAVVITSRHALEPLKKFPELFTLPLLAVGEEAARRAERLGFTEVTHAPDGEALLAALTQRFEPGETPLLYVRGADISLDLAAALAQHGIAVREVVTYRMRAAAALSPACVAALSGGKIGIAPFLSVRTAEHFCDLVGQAQLQPCLQGVTALAMSEAIAGALQPLPWRQVRIPARPNLESLIASVDKLTQEE